MGNRAVIAFVASDKKDPCLYLHWNGGRASVEAFLQVAKALKLPATYAGLHDLGEIIRTKFFDDSSVYHETLETADCDNWDNGLYWINEQWAIVGRQYTRGEEEIDHDKTAMIFSAIMAQVATVREAS